MASIDPSEWRSPQPDPAGPAESSDPTPASPPVGPDPTLGWDTPPPPPPPPRRSPLRWWLTGAGTTAVVVAVVLWAVLGGGGLRYEVDPALQDHLLTESDFSDVYTLTAATQSDLDEAETPAAIDPEDVTPSECGELLSFAPPEVDATVPTAMVTAEGTYGDPVYVNGVFRLPDDVPDDAWNLDAYAEVMDSCASMDVQAEGQSVHMTVSAMGVGTLGERAVAFVVEGSAGGQQVSIAVGMVQSGDLLVMLVGVNPSDAIDEAGFTDLLEVAVERAQ